MKHYHQKNSIAPVIALVIVTMAISSLGTIAAMKPTISVCQQMVIDDLKKQKTYAAQLALIVAPDFLTELTQGE